MRIEFTRVVDETSKRSPQLIKAIRSSKQTHGTEKGPVS